MILNRQQAVNRINELVGKADDHLQEALRIANQFDIPFTFDLNAGVDNPRWESSDDWYGSSC